MLVLQGAADGTGAVSGRRVAVTGLGVVATCGIGKDAFWEGLLAEPPARDPPGHRFRRHPAVRARRRCAAIDRFAQFAVAAAEQALDDAGGLDGLSADPARTGVLIGTGVGGLETMETQIIVHHEKGPRRVSPFMVPMIMSNAGAATVSMRFGFRGPCETTVTACAAGTHSIGNAARLIASGRCDVVVAGGCEAGLTPVGLAAFTNMTALSSSGISKPFDVTRDGFVIAEGSAVLILEEWDRAAEPGRPHLRRGRRLGLDRRRPPHHGSRRPVGRAPSPAWSRP